MNIFFVASRKSSLVLVTKGMARRTRTNRTLELIVPVSKRSLLKQLVDVLDVADKVSE